MQTAGLLERARHQAGLSRSELARRAGASRPTLAAYAAGTKSPNLATAERIIQAAAYDLVLQVRDNGTGIRDGAPRSGLLNLAERAEQLGGSLNVGPADGRGTEMYWRVPLPSTSPLAG
jgi:transcriptional regulator with XRE-family HTH domain